MSTFADTTTTTTTTMSSTITADAVIASDESNTVAADAAVVADVAAADAAVVADVVVADVAAAVVVDSRIIKLVSQDGESFSVPIAVAKLSSLIGTMLTDGDGGDDDDEEEKEIPLPNVAAPILAKVIEFCEHHLQNPMTPIEKPLKDADLAKVVQEFYAAFITSTNNDTLFHLTMAANYLDVSPLLDLCSARIASFIKDKTVEQIRENLGIVCDLSPEEDARVREENLCGATAAAEEQKADA